MKVSFSMLADVALQKGGVCPCSSCASRWGRGRERIEMTTAGDWLEVATQCLNTTGTVSTPLLPHPPTPLSCKTPLPPHLACDSQLVQSVGGYMHCHSGKSYQHAVHAGGRRVNQGVTEVMLAQHCCALNASQ
jgi:hypothetical protein